MFNTSLGFGDFFWIWFIGVVMNGSSTYLTSGKEAIDALAKQTATLAEEIRKLQG